MLPPPQTHPGLVRLRERAAVSLLAATDSALEAVPFIVVTGLIVYAPMGEAMAGAGIIAAFVAAMLASLALAVIADRPRLIAGPSLGLALMLGGVLQSLITRHAITSQDMPAALAITMALTIGTGLLVALLSALAVGRLAPLVPYPVLAGLRNGTAIVLLLEQAEAVLGLSPDHSETLHPGGVVVAGITLLAMLRPIRLLRAVPRIVVALAAGLAAFQLLAALPVGEWMVGPTEILTLDDTLAMPDWPGVWHLMAGLKRSVFTGTLLPALLSMTGLALLNNIASMAVVPAAAGLRSTGQRDMLAIAAANLAGGLVGSLPVACSLDETVAETAEPQAPARLTAALRALILLAIIWLALPLLAHIPRAVFSGLIIATGLRLVDPAGMRLMVQAARAGQGRAENIGNLLVGVCVAIVAVAFGLVAAVLVGVALSLVLFVVDMASAPVRRRYASPIGRSRARRSDRETELLLHHGSDIEVIELQGALFFGSTDQIAAAIEQALRGEARYIVIDLRRVHRMDVSAARGLLSLCERLWRDGNWIALAGLRPGSVAWDDLHRSGVDRRLPPDRVFPALEDALEQAEASLLADRTGELPDPSLNSAEALAGLGIPSASIDSVLSHLHEISFAPGQFIVRAGEKANALYILLAGRVDVLLPVPNVGHLAAATRIATLAPGALLGEMSLLSGAPRSADLIAQGAVRCLVLAQETLQTLRAKDPEVAWHMLLAMALQVETNLRLANSAIASYEE